MPEPRGSYLAHLPSKGQPQSLPVVSAAHVLPALALQQQVPFQILAVSVLSHPVAISAHAADTANRVASGFIVSWGLS